MVPAVNGVLIEISHIICSYLNFAKKCIFHFFLENCPICREYLENIGVVDSGVSQVEMMLDEFYESDDSTAYVLTSDHGMTNWGK